MKAAGSLNQLEMGSPISRLETKSSLATFQNARPVSSACLGRPIFAKRSGLHKGKDSCRTGRYGLTMGSKTSLISWELLLSHNILCVQIFQSQKLTKKQIQRKSVCLLAA